jgi:hypothetical protein
LQVVAVVVRRLSVVWVTARLAGALVAQELRPQLQAHPSLVLAVAAAPLRGRVVQVERVAAVKVTEITETLHLEPKTQAAVAAAERRTQDQVTAALALSSSSTPIRTPSATPAVV